MDPDAQSASDALDVFEHAEAREKSDVFDDRVEPALSEFGARVRQEGAGDARLLAEWLAIQARIATLAVGVATDVTFDLFRANPERLRDVARSLPDAEQATLARLFAEFDGEEDVPAESLREEEAFRSRTAEAQDFAADRPAARVLGAFTGSGTFRSARGFDAVKGLLTISSPGGDVLGRYEVTSGGGARTFRMTNGPTPPGIYRVSNHRPGRTTVGMVRDGVGFSFDLDPVDDTPVYRRSLFRIHPDGSSPGTNGCLGIVGDAATQRDCESTIAGLLSGGPFRVTVAY